MRCEPISAIESGRESDSRASLEELCGSFGPSVVPRHPAEPVPAFTRQLDQLVQAFASALDLEPAELLRHLRARPQALARLRASLAAILRAKA